MEGLSAGRDNWNQWASLGRLLAMGNMDPEPAISCNQARLPVKGL